MYFELRNAAALGFCGRYKFGEEQMAILEKATFSSTYQYRASFDSEVIYTILDNILQRQ